MSERIVSDPSQHGWVEVNGKWVWDGSGSGGGGAGMVISETEPTDKVEGMQWLNPTTGLVLFWDDEKWLQMPTTGAPGADGNIADATEQGVVATWDDTAKQWTPDSSLTIDPTGNALFSGFTEASSVVSRGSLNGTAMTLTRDGLSMTFSPNNSGAGTNAFIRAPSGVTFDIGNADNVNALRIDAAGNAKFSDSIAVGSGSDFNSGPISTRGNGISSVWNDGVTRTRLARFENADTEAVRTTMTLWSDNNRGVVLQAGANSGSLSLGTRTGSTDQVNMTIDGATGNVGINKDSPSMPLDVHYGGYVDGAKNTIARFTATNDMSRGIEFSSYTQNTGYGGRFDINVKGTGSQNRLSFSQIDVISLEFNTQQDATFAGRIFKNGGTQEVLSTRDLIETLSTLRNATKDETVDVRQALASACDKLIEKFEAMQSTATQEISDE